MESDLDTNRRPHVKRPCHFEKGAFHEPDPSSAVARRRPSCCRVARGVRHCSRSSCAICPAGCGAVHRSQRAKLPGARQGRGGMSMRTPAHAPLFPRPPGPVGALPRAGGAGLAIHTRQCRAHADGDRLRAAARPRRARLGLEYGPLAGGDGGRIPADAGGAQDAVGLGHHACRFAGDGVWWNCSRPSRACRYSSCSDLVRGLAVGQLINRFTIGDGDCA